MVWCHQQSMHCAAVGLYCCVLCGGFVRVHSHDDDDSTQKGRQKNKAALRSIQQH